jgi:hypothetical protein
MGKVKLTIEYIQTLAEEKECKLLSTEYTKITDKNLEILYKCGHKSITSLASFKLSKTGLCRKCLGSQKYTLEEVREMIENKGCKLISEEYIGVIKPLKILFSCGHEDTKSLDVFMDTFPLCKKCSKNASVTFEEAKLLIEENDYMLLDEYYKINSKSKLNIKDNEDFKYALNINQFKKHISEGTPLVKFHMDNPYTFENINRYLVLINYPLILDPNEFSWNGSAKKMTFLDKDGYKYYSSFNLLQENLKTHGYGYRFSPFNVHTIDNIKKWLIDNNKPFELIDGQSYKKNNQKLKFKCFNCPLDEIPFEISWGAVYNGQGCGICKGFQKGKYNNLKYLYPKIAEEFDFEKNYPKTPELISPMTHDNYYWICPECNHNYKANVCDRTAGGNSCPKCNDSKGERKIRNYLDEIKNVNQINYISQYKFDDCKNIKCLPFDFAIFKDEQLLAVCEYQGEQHTRPIDLFGGLEGFNKTCYRDNIKREYCKFNNIHLIEIYYYDFNNIEKILEDELLSVPIKIPILNLQVKEVYA